MRKATLIVMIFLMLFSAACSKVDSQTAAENLPEATPAAILPMVSSAGNSGEGASAETAPTPAAILPMVGLAGQATEAPAEAAPTPAAILPMIGANPGTTQAQALIGDYARAVLGIEVEVQIGTGLARDLSLPLALEEGVSEALALSGVSYFGILKNGVALLGMGEGTLSGDTNADLQDGSLGVFSLQLRQDMPADAAAALALIQQTYPGLAAREFFADGTEAEVFAFSASQAQDYSLNNGQATITGTLVRAGVSPSARPNVVIVWVVVASGALTAPWE